ncbi:MAG: Dabb family protein [Oscillospiraceae bacterium]
MLKHIVMWEISEGEGKSKAENIEIVKLGLEALSQIISELKSLEMIKNEIPNGKNYDLMLVATVENEQDLEKYKNHPQHQEIAKYLSKITISRAAIDYNF